MSESTTDRPSSRGTGESPPPFCRDAQPPQPPTTPAEQINAPWVEGAVPTPVGDVPRAATTLTRADRSGAWKARWGIGRMSYRVEPRLYAVGSPTDTSPVFVTANYKMSFDRLRSALCGRDGWILVLDTHGINVWCAAGKGTFGTDEIVRRIEVVRLDRVVSHRTLVVPQLGAVGVAAHEVRARSGFAVTYGPVRAEDLPAFLDAEMTATPEMRRVKFTFRDRVALIPVELVASGRYVLLAAVCFALLSGLNGSGYSFALVGSSGAMNAMLLAIAALGGAAIAPALLPWLPGRALATKGACLGMLLNLGIVAIAGTAGGWFESLWSLNGWLLMVPAVVSFMTMNFTGSTPYTSLSGVRREMRFAIPGQMFLGLAGLVLWVVGRFV